MKGARDFNWCPICGSKSDHDTCKKTVLAAIDGSETRSSNSKSSTEAFRTGPIVSLSMAYRLIAEQRHRDDETADGQLIPYDYENGLDAWEM